ncbi:MAG: oligosaccharide flippase family protein [Planctomycetota bacterium]|jgi:O-antigen/teichoic acid export membrane protein
MNQSLSLRKNFSWALVGNVFYSACQWGMLIVLAKLGTPEMVGVYALAVAIAIPITLFGKLQLQAVFVTDARNEYFFGDYLVLRLITTLATVVIITLIALISGENTETRVVVIIVGLGQGILCIREMYLAAMQKAERMDMVSISNITQGLLSLSIFFVVVWFTHSLICGVIGLLLARICVLISHDLPRVKSLVAGTGPEHRRFSEIRQHWKGLLKLVWISFPIGIAVALISLNASIPKYFIKHYHGEATLGYYAAMASLLTAGYMVIGALGQSACPRLAKYFVASKTAYRNLLVKLVGVGFALGLFGLLLTCFFGKHILTIVFTTDYANYNREFNWIMLAGAIGYGAAFFGYGMTAARYFKVQAFIWVIVVIITALSSRFFVPNYGIKGAAWSMSIALVVGIALIIVVTAYILRRPESSPYINTS